MTFSRRQILLALAAAPIVAKVATALPAPELEYTRGLYYFRDPFAGFFEWQKQLMESNYLGYAPQQRVSRDRAPEAAARPGFRVPKKTHRSGPRDRVAPSARLWRKER